MNTKRSYQKTGMPRKKSSFEVAPETKVLIAAKINNYLLKFGGSKAVQEVGYNLAKKPILGVAWNSIDCLALGKKRKLDTVKRVMDFFSLAIDTETLQKDGIIKHLENEG